MKKNRLGNVWSSTAADEPTEPEQRKAVTPAAGETITVGAKVYKPVAYHWAAQSKIHRRPVSDVIRDALIEEFGLPDGFDRETVAPVIRKDVKT
jgi:hypothetical protein